MYKAYVSCLNIWFIIRNYVETNIDEYADKVVGQENIFFQNGEMTSAQ